MDHKIIKTKLKFVLSVVELPKNIKKSNYDFWFIFSLFWSFSNFEGPYLGLTLSKSQNFCKIRILRIRFTQKVKNRPKKALLADFDFFTVIFWQSDSASALVTTKSITSIFFWTVFWWIWKNLGTVTETIYIKPDLN